MISKTPLSNATISCANVKIHESLFIWLGSLILWHVVFSTYGEVVENVEYLQWGATAFTVMWLSKLTVSRNNCDFLSFLGSIDKSSVPEILFAAALAILIGIGCWSILVFVEAQVNPDWTYHWWGLVTPTDFGEIRWVKSWLFVHLVSGTILVPITEEIIFRGLILRRLMSKYDIWTAIWFSSLIFAFFHINKSFVGSFFHSILFSMLAIRFASLYAPIIVHGAYNLFAFFAQTSMGLFFAADKGKIGSMEYWATELVFLIFGIVFLAIYILKTRIFFSKHPI